MLKPVIYIVHGWGGTPESDWYAWLKKMLEVHDAEAILPAMPNPDVPKINAWVSHLNEVVRNPSLNTYFVGHSIGCQTILRYLEILGKERVGGCLFIAPWLHLKETGYETESERQIAKPWIETPISWEKIRRHCSKFVSVFARDDPFVPVEESKMFEERLGSKTIVMPVKAHFTSGDGYKELHVALNETLKLIGHDMRQTKDEV